MGSNVLEQQVDQILTATCGRPCVADELLFETEALDSLKLMGLILQLERELDVALITESMDFDDFATPSSIKRTVQLAREAKVSGGA